jgi:hypothetical protein
VSDSAFEEFGLGQQMALSLIDHSSSEGIFRQLGRKSI